MAATTTSNSSGVTLVELLVALAVLGVMAGFVAASWRPDQWSPQRAEAGSAAVVVQAARHRALQTGRSVGVTIPFGQDSTRVVALPDGRVIGAEALGVDALSGEPARGARP
jgi:prepilin-type N-terminal cleavage/methylation domain-containing protein